MKKIDAVPTRDNLIDFMRKDALDRNSDLLDFAGILESIESDFSIFLDGEWGCGKTFFVKQLVCLLEGANALLDFEGDIEDLIGDGGPLQPYSNLNGFLPVYYNAWENDHWDDPLPSIATAIALQGKIHADFRKDAKISEKISGSLEAILGLFGRSGASVLRETFSGKNLIEAYQEREELRMFVSHLVDAVLPEKANKLLLVVDELDRCRPPFAIKVLEQVKSLFNDDRVITVYSVNSVQLSHAIEGAYGFGFDGQRYLSRFYDLSIPLRKVDSLKYLELNGLSKTENRFDIISYGLVEAYSMTMRDANRYLAELLRARPLVMDACDGLSNDWVRAFAIAGVAPTTLLLKTIDPGAYTSVTQSLDVKPLRAVFSRCNEAMDFMDETWGSYVEYEKGKTPSEEDKEAKRCELLEAVVYAIWCKDTSNAKYRHSYDVIGRSWSFGSLRNLARII